MKDRVKYYSSNDIFFGHNFSKIETLKIPSFKTIDINDAIEFFQIEQYFNVGIHCKTWTDEDRQIYLKKSNELSALTKRFFNQINNENVIGIYNVIEQGYHSDFWILFNNCKLYKRISAEVFNELINGENISPHDLFLNKMIVCNYGNVLRDYILSNEYCISIVLHVYEQDYVQGDRLTLPSELTGEDICNYLEKYIDGAHPNVNHLRAIINMNVTKQFPITDEIRLKAKRRYEVETKNISKTGVSIYYGIQLLFNPEQDEVKLCTHNDREIVFSYSTKWLLETLDYPSILNNFIYVFEFVDIPQMRCAHVNRISRSVVFERAFTTKSSRVYPCNYAFRFNQELAAMQMQVYYDFLEKQGVRLEDVLKWFFTEYVQQEFSCAGMRVSMPSANSSYAEKCSSIITAFESVLKQYSLYVKHGEIDFELLGMSTTPIRFDDVRSLVSDKYLHGTGDAFKRLSFWLFSDQCMFAFVERLYKEGKRYDCFIDLLLSEEVFLSDYREDERIAFEDMASFDLLFINDDGKIMPKDRIKLEILRDLYEKDVVSYKHYPLSAAVAISYFLEKGIVEAKSTLFSKPEIDYLNYLLNRAEYSNGLEIRNRYIHGILQVNDNEDVHRQNYLILLRLFVLLAIKINDDLCLLDSESMSEK